MKLYPFTLASAASGVLFLAMTATWAPALGGNDHHLPTISGPLRHYGMVLDHGRLIVYGLPHLSNAALSGGPLTADWRSGVILSEWEWRHVVRVTKMTSGQTTGLAVAVHSFLLMPLLAVLPIIYVAGLLRHARRRRLGQCIRCGFDLRASTGRCPECGSKIAERTSA